MRFQNAYYSWPLGTVLPSVNAQSLDAQITAKRLNLKKSKESLMPVKAGTWQRPPAAGAEQKRSPKDGGGVLLYWPGKKGRGIPNFHSYKLGIDSSSD